MKSLALTALLALPSVATSAPEITGYLNVFNYVDHARALGDLGVLDERPGDAFRQARSGFRAQLQLDGRAGDQVAYLLSLNFEYDSRAATYEPTTTAEDGFRVFPKEAYIDLSSLGPFDLRVGRQYLFWGRFEWGGLLDVLAPWDFSAIAAEKENFRLAVDAIDARLYLGDFVIEAVVLQNFQPSRMNLALPPTIGPLRVELQPAELPGDGLNDLETATRLRYEGAAFFLALDYYRGYDRIFSMHTEAVGEGFNVEALHFTPTYHPLQVLGTEAEWLLGPVALKLEAGYLHTDDPDGDDLEVTNRHLAFMVGADWAATEDLTVNLQYGQTHLLDYNRQTEYEARQAAGEPDPYVARTLQHRAVGRIRYTFTDDLRWQAMVMANLPDSNMLGLTFLAWDLLPDARLYFGSIFFTGPDGTTFGRLEEESRLFTELKVAL